MSGRRISPPPAWQALLAVLLPADVRRETRDDLAVRFRDRLERDGARRARRWYRWQVLRTLPPALGERWRRARWDTLRATADSGRHHGLRADAREALHGAQRRPLLTAAVAGTVALGVGAAAALGVGLDQLWLDPLPYPDPGGLVMVWGRSSARAERFPLAAPDVAVLREGMGDLASIAFVLPSADMALETAAGPRHVRIGIATTDLFDVLDVSPATGRTFLPDDAVVPPGAGDDDTPLPPAPILLGSGLWRAAWGGDDAVVGRDVQLDRTTARVVGVLAAGFTLRLPADAGHARAVDGWLPLRADLADFRRTDGRLVDRDSDNAGATIARLARGVTFGRFRAELDAIGARLRESVPVYEETALRLEAVPMAADVARDSADLLTALSLGVGLLLVICWVNASTLWLTSVSSRGDELRVRAALGASHGRLLRTLMLEWLVAAGAGTLLGIGTAALVAPRVTAHLGLGDAGGAGVPALALAAAALGTAAPGALLALLPAAIAVRRDLSGRGGRTGGSRLRARRTFSAAQVAVAVVLLVAAGLLARSTLALLRVDPGFESGGRLTVRMSLRGSPELRGPAGRAAFVNELVDAIGAIPGVDAVGLAGSLPLTGERWSVPYGPPAQPPEAWASNRADFRTATSGYFAALGVRLLAGRTFTADEDRVEEHRVVVVDETLAARIAPDGRAVGHRIGVPVDGLPRDAEIVGVVRRVRQTSLRSDGPGTIYAPYRQEASRDVSLVISTRDRHPESLVGEVRAAVARLDSGLPLYDVATMAQHVAASLRPARVASVSLGAFGAVAVGSSALGLYGVLALAIGDRRREIGVRLALGATPRGVLASILRSGLVTTAAGTACGAALALAVLPRFRGLLYGVGPLDPPTWAAVIAGIAAIGVAATWIPARRAASIEPREALRSRT